MSLKSKNLLETNHYEIEFDVDKATFEAAVEKAYRKEVKKINIPGFRKGKAPRSMIEKMYGKEVFYEEAYNEIIPEAFESALTESELKPINRPQFDIVSNDENGVVFKASFYTMPEINLKEYKNYEIEREIKAVTDEDLDNSIKADLSRQSKTVTVEGRAVENGDIAVIDYEGFVGDVAFDGGKAEKYNLEIGSGNFIPGFEEQIIGHNAGESFDITVKFPEEYHSADLAGKDAIFKITLHEIKANELPELNDEFAADMGFENVDAYKADVKEKLEKKNKDNADKEVEGKIIDMLLENFEGEIPGVMYDAEVENLVRDQDSKLRMYGLDLNNYLKYQNKTLDAFKEELRPAAERQVKTRLALEKIVSLENISATDDEAEEEFERMATAYGMKKEEVKEYVTADAIKADICVKKAVDFLKESAKVTDK